MTFVLQNTEHIQNPIAEPSSEDEGSLTSVPRIAGVLLLTAEANGHDVQQGDEFMVVAVHDPDADERIQAQSDSLSKDEDTFYIIYNVHGIVRKPKKKEDNTIDTYSLPAIQGSSIWNEEGAQEPADIQFLTDKEGEALWDKVRRV